MFLRKQYPQKEKECILEDTGPFRLKSKSLWFPTICTQGLVQSRKTLQQGELGRRILGLVEEN